MTTQNDADHCSTLNGLPGEYSHLLREIEKEAVPERLLELALQLQAALASQRNREVKIVEHVGKR